MAEVDKVLAEIGAADVPRIIVLNKQDLTGLPAAVERDEYGRILRVRVSAVSGEGLPLLRQALAEHAVEKSERLSRERRRCGANSDPTDLLESAFDTGNP
jgi:GTP-binding protein HflX